MRACSGCGSETKLLHPVGTEWACSDCHDPAVDGDEPKKAEVLLWEFPSYKAARRAYETAGARIHTIAERDDGLSIIQSETSPRSWVIGSGPNIDRHTIGGGKFVICPDDLADDYRRRMALLGMAARVSGGDIRLHEGRLVPNG